MAYVIFALAEAILYIIKIFAEAALNQYFAANQMQIETGFLYGDAINAVNLIWLVCSLGILAAAAAHYFTSKKE